MIRLVTIEREYGAGGAEIARLVAQRLGWKLWDHLLTEEIARLMGCPCQTVEEREERTGFAPIPPVQVVHDGQL